MSVAQEKRAIEDLEKGVCFECPQEKNFDRLNPPITPDENNQGIIIVCTAQNDRTMHTRGDIGGFKQCRFFIESQKRTSSLNQFGAGIKRLIRSKIR